MGGEKNIEQMVSKRKEQISSQMERIYSRV